MATIRLTLNRKRRSLEIDPEMPLLWVLRDVLGLTGTKFSCGRGLCGACTVHVDGEPRRSCVLPVREVAEKRVTTIEGLSESGTHPLQNAWCDLNVPQCGYCQPGQLMTAAALVRGGKVIDGHAIEEAMNDNLCRCGTYLRIIDAIRVVPASRPAGGTTATENQGPAVRRHYTETTKEPA